MSRVPTQDTLEFAAALTLGALLGWTAVNVFRSEAALPGRGSGEANRGSERGASILRALGEEARRLAAESGRELAKHAMGVVRRSPNGDGAHGGR